MAATGPLDAPVVFISDAPRKLDVMKGEALTGTEGQKLSSLLYKHRVTRDQVYVTHALCCRPEVPGNEGVRRYDVKLYMAWFRKQNQMRKRAGFPVQKSPFECCRPRLAWELKWLDHHAVARGAPSGIVIQPLGNFAVAVAAEIFPVGGKLGSVMKFRGSVIEPLKAGAL